jgi:hypothetical protein
MAAVSARRWTGAAAVAVLVALSLPACSAPDGPCRPDLGEATSVARVWNEVNLDAIRRDFPAPTVHARNLFHLSGAMWDAWAAYDPAAAGYLVTETQADDNPDRVRQIAISQAASAILRVRYADTSGSEETLDHIDATMESLCLSADAIDSSGNERPGDVEAAELGGRIADAYLDLGASDGSNEAGRYADDTYQPANQPLAPALSGTVLDDPDRWQPLDLDRSIGQNGVELPDGVQLFVGSQWGSVTSFALPPDPEDGLPLDPGPPPYLADPETADEYRESALEVIRYSSLLDPRDAAMVDISPAAQGDNPLGTYDGEGRAHNPVTGDPYEPNVVDEGDFGRVLAEFWADGPDSETPPGHWNTIANQVTDDPDLVRRIGGEGPEVDPLEWDVKLYLALNGAAHDAAIAAWGAKAYYDYVRPISMIRYLGDNGQSSDPELPAYDPQGLPLEPGLVELATRDTLGPGGRHERTEAFPDEVVIRAWRGNPLDAETEFGGVGWIRAADWVPYQRETFVTPAFAAYVSGHSAFSRAAAEVLTAMTGSEYFPGGLGEWTIEAGDLEFEAGPDEDVTLQWATFADAADQAGVSRLYDGIHVRADDLAGRVMGAEVGRQAFDLARTYYDPTETG